MTSISDNNHQFSQIWSSMAFGDLNFDLSVTWQEWFRTGSIRAFDDRFAQPSSPLSFRIDECGSFCPPPPTTTMVKVVKIATRARFNCLSYSVICFLPCCLMIDSFVMRYMRRHEPVLQSKHWPDVIGPVKCWPFEPLSESRPISNMWHKKPIL